MAFMLALVTGCIVMWNEECPSLPVLVRRLLSFGGEVVILLEVDVVSVECEPILLVFVITLWCLTASSAMTRESVCL